MKTPESRMEDIISEIQASAEELDSLHDDFKFIAACISDAGLGGSEKCIEISTIVDALHEARTALAEAVYMMGDIEFPSE
jgi:hypothetical protein